jgi:hypothetical protein
MNEDKITFIVVDNDKQAMTPVLVKVVQFFNLVTNNNAS